MWRNRGKKIMVGLLMGCMAGSVVPAQAGLFGSLVGGVIEHHIENQQASNGADTIITDHPVAGAVAGSVVGAAAQGMAVHEIFSH